ncbi:MAG TPA: hypothetical protein VMG60_11430 [Burkholderiaceae bacterium]|nr:hypothetical protein [Burkholderiaceae bacterium]
MAKSWEATAGSTDFVITTVNVPDRLDVQEVRAREDEDDERTERFRIDWYAIRTWIVRLVLLGLLAGAALFAWEWVQPLRDELSPPRIAERLSQATGQPVTVGGAEFKITPTPRFVISDVQIANVWRSSDISLHFNWDDAWRALRGGGWVWAEASVGPTTLEAAQGEFLMRTIPRLSQALPTSISTIRFESVQFQGIRELNSRFEGVVRRSGDGKFTAVTLRSGDGNATLNASVAEGGESIAIQFDATNWAATIGPSIPWSEIHASMRARAGLVEIPEFLLAGYFGSIKGSAYAAADVEWAITGVAMGSNLDLEAVLRQLAGKPVENAPQLQVPVSGVASFDVLLAGRGPSLSEAIASTVASGPLRVRWATVNGINLGYVASRPGTQSGGITRFTDLTGWLSAGPAGVSFQDLNGRAGALSTHGEVAVAPDRRVSGSLRVDLGGARILAPLNVQVHGTLLAPEYGPQ